MHLTTSRRTKQPGEAKHEICHESSVILQSIPQRDRWQEILQSYLVNLNPFIKSVLHILLNWLSPFQCLSSLREHSQKN